MLLLCVSRPRWINRDDNLAGRVNGPGMNVEVAHSFSHLDVYDYLIVLHAILCVKSTT